MAAVAAVFIVMTGYCATATLPAGTAANVGGTCRGRVTAGRSYWCSSCFTGAAAAVAADVGGTKFGPISPAGEQGLTATSPPVLLFCPLSRTGLPGQTFGSSAHLLFTSCTKRSCTAELRVSRGI